MKRKPSSAANQLPLVPEPAAWVTIHQYSLFYNSMTLLNTNKQRDDPTSTRSGKYTRRKGAVLTASCCYKAEQRNHLIKGGLQY